MWSKEFPTEEGDYWFYGYRYGRISCGTKCEPEWMRVEVHKSASGLLYIAEGQFMYKSEVEDAHFMKIEYPEPPKLSGE